MKKIIPFSPKNGNAGCMVGIEFKIESSVILDAVRFYITDYGKPSTQYSYGILKFSDNNIPSQKINELSTSFNDSLSCGNSWIENNFKHTHAPPFS